MGWEIEWWEAMKLTRRTLLQSLASLFPLSALGLGRAPNQSGTASPRLPEPPGGDEVPPKLSVAEWSKRHGFPAHPEDEMAAKKAWGDALRREPPGGAREFSYPKLPSRKEHHRMLREHQGHELDAAMIRILKGGAW